MSYAAALLSLKREFRSLADVAHPNLACLYELTSLGDRSFFTMELVDGCNFLDHVWARSSDPDAPPERTWTGSGPTGAARASSAPLEFVLDRDRLRAGTRQLCDGIAALHQAGKLHRDIKPSNVLVTATGRVVLLDFGLVEEIGSRRSSRRRHARLHVAGAGAGRTGFSRRRLVQRRRRAA